MLPNPGVLMMSPMTALHLWADLNRAAVSAMPASLLIAVSPFFWAPPLWVGALMATQSVQAHGGPAGSTATPKEAASPKRTVAPVTRRRPVGSA
ncbi:MAG TPA: hypothetical protein VD978_08790 [Azospirillum sp.]|nr:hypothetical protein [Azospirillum sp.]